MLPSPTYKKLLIVAGDRRKKKDSFWVHTFPFTAELTVAKQRFHEDATTTGSYSHRQKVILNRITKIKLRREEEYGKERSGTTVLCKYSPTSAVAISAIERGHKRHVPRDQF